MDETLSSTGRGESAGAESPAPLQPARVDAGSEKAQPEPVTGASVPDSAGASQPAPAAEAGEVSGDGVAAAAPDTASHPAAPLINEARAARAEPDDGAAPTLEVPPDLPPGLPVRLTYPVRSPLRHSGRRYSADDPHASTIELTEAEAETLIAIGVLGEHL